LTRGEARFWTAVVEPEGYPEPRGPEVVFAGRSNVGKSSLLNALTGRRGLARTSRTPGRTQQVNFFDTSGLGTFVDLPGYGYARVPTRVRRSWKPLVEGYLRGGRPVVLFLLLVDARHAPTRQDVEMMDWLREAAWPARVVLTKADTVAGSRLRQSVAQAAETLGLDIETQPPIPASARTGKGLNEVRALIHRAVKR
jgi:GTP-binding protein